MNQLWAPWRMEYIKDHKATSHCIFCQFIKEKTDAENLILHRHKTCFIIMNKYPYNNGHLMVVPNAHVGKFEDLSLDTFQEIGELLQVCERAIGKCYKPQGYNIGMNIGEAAGAGVKDHLHAHIVPRWMGDTNFMPVLSETKSMPQHLSASYDKLAEAIRSEVK